MILINKRTNRRAQIGSAITWFFSFVIVFFLLILFGIAGALFALQQSAPTVSPLMIGSKSVNINLAPAEPSGYDPGDLALQSDIITFLNSESEYLGARVSMGNLVGTFDRNIYGAGQFNSGQIKENANYKIFYDNATTFFDRIYDECYVLCLEFTDSGSIEPRKSQVIIGAKCPMRYSSGEDIYSRDFKFYGCFASTRYTPSGNFNYAVVELPPLGENQQVSTRIRMMRGDIVGDYPKDGGVV